MDNETFMYTVAVVRKMPDETQVNLYDIRSDFDGLSDADVAATLSTACMLYAGTAEGRAAALERDGELLMDDVLMEASASPDDVLVGILRKLNIRAVEYTVPDTLTALDGDHNYYHP